METLLFYVLGVVTLASAVCVVALRRPIHNVLFMILTMIGIGGLFILLQAEFVAMVQLVVYAGAVMVLFLFVIMLLNLERTPRLPDQGRDVRWWGGMVLGIVLLNLMFPVLKAFVPAPAGQVAAPGLSNTARIAKEVFTTYLLPFEIVSVLLLAAIIGTVIIVRKRP